LDPIIGGWRKLHNEELNFIYSLLDRIRMIKSKRVRWLGHIACMEEMMHAYGILGRPSTCRRIIFKWILEKWDGVVWT
jgi:hypothetical protein